MNENLFGRLQFIVARIYGKVLLFLERHYDSRPQILDHDP